MTNVNEDDGVRAFKLLLKDDFDTYRSIFQECLQSEFDEQSRARALYSIGQSYLMERDWLNAERYFNQAISLFRSTKDLLGLATSLSQQALVLSQQAKTELAEKLIAESVDIGRKLKLDEENIHDWFLAPFFSSRDKWGNK
ncbi:MAG: tetratricopeptide repeat protein [Pyrinomonadaceae bacterium]